MRRAFVFAVIGALGLGCLPEPKKRDPAPQAATSAEDASAVSTEAIAYAIAGPSASGRIAAARAEMLVQVDCLTCHDSLLLEQQRLGGPQWHSIVKRMQGWGSQVADKDVAGLSAWLTERYGPDAGAFTPKPIDASEVTERIAPLPDEGFGGGDPVRGAEAFRTYCIGCHGADAKGGSVGIKLVDSPIVTRAPDIVKTIRTGRGRMGAFPSIEDADIRAIIAFLRSRKAD